MESRCIDNELMNDVLAEAATSFINGNTLNVNAIKGIIIKDFLDELHGKFPDGYTEEQFNILFDNVFAMRVYDWKNIKELKNKPINPKSGRSLTFDIDIAEQYQRMLDEEFHKSKIENKLTSNRVSLTGQVSVETSTHKTLADYESFVQMFKKSMQDDAILLSENSSDSFDQSRNLQPADRYCLYVDNFYPDYDANRIEGTNFIACRGPESDTVANFFHDVILKNNETYPPVIKVIAIGDCLSVKRNDFFNYLFVDNDADTKKITVKSADYDCQYDLEITNQYSSYVVGNESAENNPNFAVTKLSISDSDKNNYALEALIIKTPDKGALDLSDNTVKNEKLKCALLEASRQCKTGSVVVHCRRGIGRTGHIILTLEIFNNFNYIFENNSSEEIILRINSTLSRIRTNRTPLIDNIQQYVFAIQNAIILYNYALKKNYIAGLEQSLEEKSLSQDSGLGMKQSGLKLYTGSACLWFFENPSSPPQQLDEKRLDSGFHP